MPLIIDGYNLLRTVEKMDSEGPKISDAGMCRALSEYLRLTCQKGEIVFDGLGPPDKSVFNNIAYLEIIFSGTNTDADSIIIDKIERNTAPRNLIVVSSDRELRNAAASRHAVPIKSDLFWMQLQKELERKRAVPEPREKQTGISSGQADEWLKLFGLDDSDNS